MRIEEYNEIMRAVFILNKYRNEWSHSDWRHEQISNLINAFLPSFSNDLEWLLKASSPNPTKMTEDKR